MAMLGELREMLLMCRGGGSSDVEGYLDSLNLIPDFSGDKLLYTPTRPDCLDSENFLNVIAEDSNVYPLYLQYLVKNDGLGASFAVKPTDILKKFISAFENNEILNLYGDGRSSQHILRLPLTLDYYTYFNGKENGLRLFLVFLLSFLFSFENGINVFQKKRPKNLFTSFSLNSPFAEVIDLDTFYVLQRELVVFLESVNFKEVKKDSVKQEAKAIIAECKVLGPIEVIVAKQVRVVEYCSECARVACCSPYVRPIIKEESFDDVTIKKRDVKWSFSTMVLDFEVVHKNKKTASEFFNIVGNSLFLKKDGHCHLLGVDTAEVKITDDIKISFEHIDRYIGRRIYTNVKELVRDIFIQNGINKDDAFSVAIGNGMYLTDVPYNLLCAFPFFVRNYKKLFIKWSNFHNWYRESCLSGIFNEVEDIRFGHLILCEMKSLLI